jgi:hypothetical protein
VLRLDEPVAGVLVPRESARLVGLLVHRLVPVEVDVGPDQIVAEPDECRVLGQRACRGGAQNGVDRKRDGASLRDVDTAVVLLGEVPLHVGLELVELGEQRSQDRGADQLTQDEEAITVKGRPLRIADHLWGRDRH